MKKVFLVVAALLAAVVTYARFPNEKVLKAFSETFTQVEEVKWEEYPDYCTVSFKIGSIRSKAIYNMEGVMLGSLRYYMPDLLPLNILNTLKRKYRKKQLFSVTEVTYDNTITYFVKMEDDQHWYTVKVETPGITELIDKYRKA